jgi:ABC-type sugar transport system ATPase subunit
VSKATELFSEEGFDGGTRDLAPRLGANIGVGYFPLYRLSVIGATAAVLLAHWLFLEKTNFGLIIRAGARDPQIVRVLGVDVARVWLIVFGIGTAITGFARLLAAPLQGVIPEMGGTILAEAFVTVVGGMGSIGAVLAGLLVGVVVSMISLFAYDIWRPRARLVELTEQADKLLALVGLWEARERTAKTLPHGEQRALEVGMALASRPRLLLLDEPTAGMSPEETRTMMDLIVKLASERTIILVEHKMKLVLGISDRILVLHHGELLAEGTPSEVRRNEAVKRVYLGQREH